MQTEEFRTGSFTLCFHFKTLPVCICRFFFSRFKRFISLSRLFTLMKNDPLITLLDTSMTGISKQLRNAISMTFHLI